ncbi:MAG: hypothetical protein MUE62_03875 [Burkholderiaceae bacterium]|nr:hypothetical protein [Burkholderiaceae bacterium]
MSSSREPPSGPAAPPPPPTLPARRALWVDVALGVLAALPVAAVLSDNGDLFLLVAAMLPVAVVAVCSFDPPDVAQLATRLRDAPRGGRPRYPGDESDERRG